MWYKKIAKKNILNLTVKCQTTNVGGRGNVNVNSYFLSSLKHVLPCWKGTGGYSDFFHLALRYRG